MLAVSVPKGVKETWSVEHKRWQHLKDLKAYSAQLSLDSELSKEILPRHVQSAIYAQIMRKQLTKYKLEPVAAIYLGTIRTLEIMENI